MKRNTTPTLCVSINVDKNKIEKLDFVFKKKNSEDDEALLVKSFDESTMSFTEGANAGEILFFIDFTAAETLLFPEGRIFMDTRILTKDNKILETEIVSFEVKSTLFSEVDCNEGN